MNPAHIPHYVAAQVRAGTDPSVGRDLHTVSQVRGRLDALERAIASGDRLARLHALRQIRNLVDVLVDAEPAGA